MLLAIVLLLGLMAGLLLRRPAESTAPPAVIVLKPGEAAPFALPASPPAAPAAPAAPVAVQPVPVAPVPRANAATPASPPIPGASTPLSADGSASVPPLPPAAIAPRDAASATEPLEAEAAAPTLEVRTFPNHHAPPRPAANPAAASLPAPRQLQQMPDAYRAHFPSIAVDVHVYDEDPSRRFVIIGGQRYVEGDALGSGPRLVQIVPEGFVVDWQGQRVLFALAR
jgi:general secretion pathway protein B